MTWYYCLTIRHPYSRLICTMGSILFKRWNCRQGVCQDYMGQLRGDNQVNWTKARLDNNNNMRAQNLMIKLNINVCLLDCRVGNCFCLITHKDVGHWIPIQITIKVILFYELFVEKFYHLWSIGKHLWDKRKLSILAHSYGIVSGSQLFIS